MHSKEQNIWRIYHSFTETYKLIPINYDVWGKIVSAKFNGDTELQLIMKLKKGNNYGADELQHVSCVLG